VILNCVKLVANHFLYTAKLPADVAVYCFFREIQKALQDCRALYPRLELSTATACGAHVLKVRCFCISVHNNYYKLHVCREVFL